MAVRMPAHPVARALIAAAGVPLAAPSANTSGRPSPTSAQHVLQDLDGAIAAVVDGGACACGVESTVLDGLRRPPAVLRPGGITAEQLRGCAGMAGLQVYQRDFCDAQLEAQPTTPGMKYRHYSPSAHLVLLDPTPAWQQQQQQQGSQCSRSSLEELVAAQTDTLLQQLLLRHQHGAAGGPRQHIVLLSTCHPAGPGQDQQQQCPGWTVSSLHALQSASQQQLQQQQQEELATPRVLQYVLGSWQQPEVIAQHVFAALRAADATQPAAIVVQGLPPHGAGLAVMNRLLKAASQRVDVDAGVLGSCRR
jgi:L-threonylcarbamoyladenylate synthase